MCRMIAAVGRFRMEPLVDALRMMAANANHAYEHEVRAEGNGFQHDCGWGVAYRDGRGLARHRSPSYCVEDPVFSRMEVVETDLAILHARRTPDRSTIDIQNSHPFVVERGGTTWAFCHNGTVNDPSQLEVDAATARSAGTDSELLFHHILGKLDAVDPVGSIAATLGEIRDFTCLNCFLATPDDVFAHARVSPDTTRPRYYTLWIGRGDGFTVASSEVIPQVDVRWEPLTDGTAVRLTV